MDKRKNNGGHSTKGKAGRPPKAEELRIAETMDNILSSDVVLEKLSKLVNEGNLKAIELWLAYRVGKPQQKIDHTTNGEDIHPPISWS